MVKNHIGIGTGDEHVGSDVKLEVIQEKRIHDIPTIGWKDRFSVRYQERLHNNKLVRSFPNDFYYCIIFLNRKLQSKIWRRLTRESQRTTTNKRAKLKYGYSVS